MLILKKMVQKRPFRVLILTSLSLSFASCNEAAPEGETARLAVKAATFDSLVKQREAIRIETIADEAQLKEIQAEIDGFYKVLEMKDRVGLLSGSTRAIDNLKFKIKQNESDLLAIDIALVQY